MYVHFTDDELLEDGDSVEVHEEVCVGGGDADIPLLPLHRGEPNQPTIHSKD